MKDGIVGICGVCTNLLFSITDIESIVGIVCSVVILLTTCSIQVYRAWRDKDKDIKSNQLDDENKKE